LVLKDIAGRRLDEGSYTLACAPSSKVGGKARQAIIKQELPFPEVNQGEYPVEITDVNREKRACASWRREETPPSAAGQLVIRSGKEARRGQPKQRLVRRWVMIKATGRNAGDRKKHTRYAMVIKEPSLVEGAQAIADR
jgi:hypothetical protein